MKKWLVVLMSVISLAVTPAFADSCLYEASGSCKEAQNNSNLTEKTSSDSKSAIQYCSCHASVAQVENEMVAIPASFIGQRFVRSDDGFAVLRAIRPLLEPPTA